MSAVPPPESSPLSETRLEEIERRLAWITPGPWSYDDDTRCVWQDASGGTICEINFDHRTGDHAPESDAVLIANAPSYISDLLAEVRRLQSALAATSEEKAEAVKDEREACAQIVDAQAKRERGWGNDDAASVLEDMRNLILIRSRSLPSGADDGQ